MVLKAETTTLEIFGKYLNVNLKSSEKSSVLGKLNKVVK